jgi:hypothetical protein
MKPRVSFLILLAILLLASTSILRRNLGPTEKGKANTLSIGILLNLLYVALLLHGCALAFSKAREGYIMVESAMSSPEIEINLQNSFIDSYKNRVMIDVMFTVDNADILPHPAFLDGDFHVAGRAPKVGLPIVAEIKNAASEKEALALIHGAKGTDRPIRLAGAWRLWSEHIGTKEEVQGKELSSIEVTNPDHVFEIHPVTLVNSLSLLDSFHPVAGYIPEKADTAFRNFENIKCRIIPKEGTTTIVIRKGQINDVEFLMEIGEEEQHVVEDGRFVNAAVLDLKGNRLVQKVRTVFVKDTSPEKMVKNLRRGDRLHVFGLPRFDLSIVDWRVKHFKDAPEILNLNLPYEIVVVGVYKNLK